MNRNLFEQSSTDECKYVHILPNQADRPIQQANKIKYNTIAYKTYKGTQ